jgi:peptidoglycan/xylan/chitin deacetylase (PgdA/CDA1 family)
LVALTFDDGPLDSVTPRMVRLLTRLEVPATFFMIGNRVAGHPELARLVDRASFAIGNHTWAHADLTSQTRARSRRALVATRRALLDAGVQPTGLARPPYGAVDDRVRRTMSALGLTPTLWTIDSHDWTGLTPRQIARSVVGDVRPHRTNVVLHHDGVTNSPATLKALPEEVETLRQRGYCFAGLDASGDPTPPVPVATVHADRSRVAEGERIRLTVRLDRPTTRAATVRVAPGGTATSPDDFARLRRVVVPAGRQAARLWLRTRQDRIDEAGDEVYFKVFGGRGIQPALVAQADIRIVDDDPHPVVSIAHAEVTASPLLPRSVPIRVSLDRERDRPTRVVVRSDLGPARVTVPAFATHASRSLTVPAGTRGRDVSLHAAGATATLTIRPSGRTWLAAARAAVARIRWPDVRRAPTF